MSRPMARRATSLPTLPRPIKPSVLPVSSVPMYAPRDHWPRLSDASAADTLRARANINASACSAAATALPPGALTTTMPRAVAASTSIVSTPAPARPMTRSLGADSSSVAVTRVSLRTSKASASGSSRANAARSPVTTRTRVCCRSKARPSSATGSATSTSGSSDKMLLSRGSEPSAAQLSLQGAEHCSQVFLVHPAHMADSNNLAFESTLAACQDDLVVLLQLTQQSPRVNALRHICRSHRGRGEPGIGEQAQVEAAQARASVLSQASMTLEQRLQAFSAHQAQRGLQPEEQAQRGRPGGAALVRSTPRLLPIEVELRKSRTGLAFPRSR